MDEKELERELIYALSEMPLAFAEARCLIKKLLEMHGEDRNATLGFSKISQATARWPA